MGKLFWSLLSQDRDPMSRDSQRSRHRYTWRGTLRHHHQAVRGFWVYCNCARGIRGVTGFSRLARGRNRDYRWADRWQCYGRRPDAEIRW